MYGCMRLRLLSTVVVQPGCLAVYGHGRQHTAGHKTPVHGTAMDGVVLHAAAVDGYKLWGFFAGLESCYPCCSVHHTYLVCGRKKKIGSSPDFPASSGLSARANDVDNGVQIGETKTRMSVNYFKNATKKRRHSRCGMRNAEWN